MKMPDEIIPAILAQNMQDFEADLSKILNSQNLSSGWIHVDLMDNIFVPNFSIKVAEMEGVNFGNLKKEVHLMVKKPDSWIRKCLELAFQRIIIHVEAEDVSGNLALIKEAGVNAVLAINPPTPISTLEPFADKIDGVLVMGVNPGFQGQSFIPETLDKIREIKAKYPDLKIEVDGAVKDWNTKDILESGADTLVVGSFLIKGDPDQNLEILHKALYTV